MLALSCRGSEPAAELATAPPFDAIVRKYGFNSAMLAYAILSPHPQMNMSISRAEADDIAAYIATLVR